MRYRSTKQATEALEAAGVIPAHYRLEHQAIAMSRSRWWAEVVPMARTCAAIWHRGRRHPMYAPGHAATASGVIPWR